MNSDCIIQKTPINQCTKNKRKYKIEVVRPASGSGKCVYREDADKLTGKLAVNIPITQQIIDDGLELPCSDDQCVRVNGGPFKDALKCILQDLQNTFVKRFNEGPGDCVQDKVVKQSMNIFIGPDADLGECEIDLSQKIDVRGKKVCLEINKALMNLQGKDKEDFLDSVLDEVFNLQTTYIKDRPNFVNLCKDTLFNKLMSIDSSINSKCSQSVFVSQDQNVFLLGDIKCQGSVFRFSQDAVVSAYMSCITGPFLDDLENDLNLKKLYEMPLDSDCVFETQVVKPCDGKVRQSQVTILRNARGKGTCPYVNNQIISEACSNSTCKVSEWSSWTPCIAGKQQRKRTVITPGDDCPQFTESRTCSVELGQRKNAEQQIPTRPSPILGENYGYEWLFYGPSYLTQTQKIIAIAIAIFLIGLWIYALFF